MDDMAQELEKYDLRKEKVIKCSPDFWVKKSFDKIWKVGLNFFELGDRSRDIFWHSDRRTEASR